jgi:hypothetical protein
MPESKQKRIFYSLNRLYPIAFGRRSIMNLDAKSLAMSFGSVTAARSMGHLQRFGCPNAWADDVDDCSYVSQRYGRLQLDINMDGVLHSSGLVDGLGRRSWLAN